MNRLKSLLLVSLCLFSSVFLRANGAGPKIEKQPAWVAPVPVNYAASSLDDEAEDGYADLLYEKQVSLARQSSFYRKAMRVLTEAGVENLSQVSVEYDPSYEQLVFHTVRIVRNGQALNRLDLAKIKTLQQEKELGRSIYNGSLTAFLILDDLRKGDVLEYSYSLNGFNPIFGNKYAENYSTGFDVPVYTLHYRLLVPKGRSVTVRNSLTDVQPVMTATGNETEYRWTLTDQHALEGAESGIPSWHDVYPMIMVSEFASWQEIGNWALALFPFSTPPADLQKKIDELKTAYPTPEERVSAALRFVQDEIRYMGIEMGVNSHQPHPPAQVFRQRFGDCKDKAYLLCTILRALNVEAYPVLINTAYKKTVTGWLPSPTVFDHTVACVVLNGKTHWFDATIAYQRGPLDEIHFPDYKVGLVVKPGTTGFTDIPFANKGKTVTKEIFTVQNVYSPVKLEVKTVFSGSYADNVRYNFKSKSVKEMQAEYRSFYAPYFKKLVSDSLRYEDNDTTGVFTTTEYYTVRDLFKEEGGSRSADLQPYLINSVVKKLEDEDRQMPFALTFPARYEEEIEVHLPADWPIAESLHQHRTDAFVFEFEYAKPSKKVVSLRYRYENLEDHVRPEGAQDYVQEWEAIDKNISFKLTDGGETKPLIAGKTQTDNTGFTVAYIVLGLCTLVTFLYRRSLRRGTS